MQTVIIYRGDGYKVPWIVKQGIQTQGQYETFQEALKSFPRARVDQVSFAQYITDQTTHAVQRGWA